MTELGRGTDSAAFGADDTWVFRFPIFPHTEHVYLMALTPSAQPGQHD